MCPVINWLWASVYQCTSATSVHRSSPFPFVPSFALLTTMTWLYHVLGPHVMVHTVSASRHPRFGTCCHLILRTVMLVTNSSSRVLRLGCLCKPTHMRRVWELCLNRTLQILDLIDWLLCSAVNADTLLQQQQWRGFKTKHSKQATGVGMKKPGTDESLKTLRLSVSWWDVLLLSCCMCIFIT